MAAGLRGRRGLVTGAARGIGRQVAQRLADEGMRMTLLDVDPAVESVAAEVGAAGVIADLRDEEATRRALASAATGDSDAAGDHDAAGGPDAAGDPDADPYWLLVNNAGVFAKTPLLEMDLGEWDDLHRVNARSMVVVMQALAPGMIASGRGGRVVNMASMAAKRGTPGEAAYAASKAAVVALSRRGHGVGPPRHNGQLDLPRLRAHRDGRRHPLGRPSGGLDGHEPARAAGRSRRRGLRHRLPGL